MSRVGSLRPGFVLASALIALAVPRPSPAQVRSCRALRIDSSTAAHWAPPLDRVINLRIGQISLRDALDRIAMLAKLRVSYSAELLPLDRAVCVQAMGEPVGRVLGDVLQGTNVAPVGIGGDQIVLAPRGDSTMHIERPAMAASLGVLDRVVVTGSATAAGAPARELPVDLNVIDGRDLARTNTNNLSDALDVYVPGVWGWAQSPNSMISSYASIRGASSFGLSYPKIYIDGIEVANPLLVSRFNPGTVDHIEVIRGPQGSALYGVDAISGVVNIVTRHDGATDGGNVGVRSTAGFSQSAFAHNVLAQDHAFSLITGSALRSFDLHVAGTTMGAFVPNGSSRDLLATASARAVTARSTMSGTARFFLEQAGTTDSPLVARPTLPSATQNTVQPSNPPQSVNQYTIGGTAMTSPTDRVTTTFVVGVDGYRLNNVQTNFTPVPNGADSALRAAQGGADRATVRGSTLIRLSSTDRYQTTLTLAIEHATLRAATVPAVTAPNSGGSNTGDHDMPASQQATSSRTVVSWQNSTGFVAQTNVALNNTFFLSGGARVEHDSRLAGADQLEALPMVGASTVGEYGDFTVKFRTAYGKGIRPPTTLSRAQFWQTRYSAEYNAMQAALGPERQSGIESGIDLYFRRVFSLQATRFDQTASGLIQQVLVPADSSQGSHWLAYKAQNVGEISNAGWEFQASARFMPLTLNGAFTLVDSRVEKLASEYTGDLIAGDRMLQVPARTASFSALWSTNQWYTSISAARALDWINYDEVALAKAFVSGTRTAHDLTGERLRQYWRRYNGGLRLRATGSRELRPGFSLELSADNLLNYQTGEPDNITVIPGRTLMTGLRLKF